MFFGFSLGRGGASFVSPMDLVLLSLLAGGVPRPPVVAPRPPVVAPRLPVAAPRPGFGISLLKLCSGVVLLVVLLGVFLLIWTRPCVGLGLPLGLGVPGGVDAMSL